jgi:hypothetical protein
MLVNEDQTTAGSNDSTVPENNKPNGYPTDNGAGLNEKDLTKNFVYAGDKNKPVTEGQPTGGQKFGENNLTYSGDDKNNPSQNAGYSNGYFKRTEPSEEHPEDTNFKTANQDGTPDYDKAQPYSKMENETPKPEKIERGNGENDRPHKGNTYQEGTDDSDGNGGVNIPGPEELPEQQKVGEPDAGNTSDRDHIET